MAYVEGLFDTETPTPIVFVISDARGDTATGVVEAAASQFTDDIVHIKRGMREMGKKPSRAARLLEQIFETHPDINAVIIAHPPAIMSFAVTDAEFDSRLIPESYISLRNVERVPYAASRLDIPGTAAIFDARHPVVIVNNQCVIVTGASLLNAYDRLEVLEYSAAAMIAAKDIGEVVYITEDEVKAIEEAFHLD